MAAPRLEVRDVLGERTVPIDKNPFSIGRRETNGLRLGGSEVSREHAEIALENGHYVIRDRQSRYGTFVNGEPVTTECELRSGDNVRLGRGGGADLVFLTGEDERSQTGSGRSSTGARDDLRAVNSLLEGFRALGSGRVLQEVLALVLDAAIELSNAERAFIMLGTPEGELEFRLARGRAKQTLNDTTFNTSRKIPEEVFRTGQARVVADLLDSGFADVHMGTVALGIRHIVCVPLNLVQYVESADARGEDRRIGVLYLDSREKGALLSRAARASLETLATEAAVAIENARLYRQTLEKARMEQELKIAAEIQQALLPEPQRKGAYFEAVAQSVPCRSIGGDFFDYVDLPDLSFGFAVGDVAGKGAPAALLTAVIQGVFSSQAWSGTPPSETLSKVNQAIIRRAIESRFCTAFYAVVHANGQMTYCNAGHNPPMLFTKTGVKRLEKGGTILGLFELATFEEDTITVEPGDILVAFSDGVTEALSASGDEYGEDRLIACVDAAKGKSLQELLDAIFISVREFCTGAVQSDDVTALVLRYDG
jgi:serine phosphatase RsbU (regulator of sigma subunit)